jgi:probable rRNA maturation factor
VALPFLLRLRKSLTEMEPTIICRRPVRGLSKRALREFVAQACRATGLKGTVTVMVTDSPEMRSLNDRFRGQNHATDVLSFPPPAFNNGFAGDIAVSLDIAARSARSLRHSLGEEVQILILHGILHLAGYDHEGDQGEMAEKEQQLRQRFGLPTGLIERVRARRHSIIAGSRGPARSRT